MLFLMRVKSPLVPWFGGAFRNARIVGLECFTNIKEKKD